MNSNAATDPSILDHGLAKYFPELLKFESTPEMEASELYARIRPEVERILNAVVEGIADRGSRIADFAWQPAVEHVDPRNPQSAIRDPQSISALAWNIERGNIFEGIVDALTHH